MSGAQSQARLARVFSRFGLTLIWLVCILASLWAAAALYFDVRNRALAAIAATGFILIVAGTLIATRARAKGMLIWFACIAAVAAWWFSLSPTNSRNWQPDVARLPWAEVNGDRMTIHEIRNCDYVTETRYTPHWETRTVDLSRLRGVDLFLVHWGSSWIAHAIMSFDFGNGVYLATSIEARKTVGQEYSAIRGFFRQFNLIYLIAEERDVMRVRTNFRKGEDVRLYRTKTTPADARRLLLAYAGWMTEVRDRPEWYNALSSNCTTGIVAYLRKAKIGGLPNLDWRTLLNGRGDEMLYQIGDFATDGLPFEQLQKRSLINPAARQAGNAPDFSQRIRAGRPGFTARGEPET